jgi:SLBB domain/Respiratory-chain NADH dehydrogenase 51 Kd subunit
MLRVCDGPACRLRAHDLRLDRDGGATPVGCLGRCDAPVAAWSHERPLVIARRGSLEAARVPAYERQRGPWAPALLRDVFFVDQPQLAAARRRGAYRALAAVASGEPHIVEDEQLRGATALASLVAQPAPSALALVDALATEPGEFAMRPLCERDPHVVVEGACLAALAVGAARVVVRVRAGWPEAAAALATAITEAQAADLLAGVAVAVEVAGSIDAPGDAPRDAPGGDAAADEAAWLLPAARAAALVRVAAIATQAPPGEDGFGLAYHWWSQHAPSLCAVSGDVLRPGVYELPLDATVADALAAAGGVIDGVRVAPLGAYLADGVLARDAARPLPTALVVFHSARDAAAFA